MSSPVRVRPATLADAVVIREIYNYEVLRTTATFDLVPRSLADQQRWIAARSGAFSAVVAELDGEIVGYASLSPYKDRAAYSTTVEDSVYVRQDRQGRGVGTILLRTILDTAEASGFHSVVARIEGASAASQALHASCGFTVVGREREVGRKFNRWLDIVIMQRLLGSPRSRRGPAPDEPAPSGVSG
jgi:phosphinothricin acetyltransferase